MEKNSRKQEILTSITAFDKEKYRKCEVLPELFKLQQEIVDLTYNGDHAENAILKLWDVEKHFIRLNKDREYSCEEELNCFIKNSKTVSNLIRSECSGNAGERKAFNALNRLESKYTILRNVELSDESDRTEIDLLVIGGNGICILEVKNTKQNIFISDTGRYYRNGEHMSLDCNIGEKFNMKERLLRKALEKLGINDVEIKSVLVFTNDNMTITNKFDYIKVAFLSQLSYIVEGIVEGDMYSLEQCKEMKDAIEEAKCNEAYYIDDDIVEIKESFANLVEAIEKTPEKDELNENEKNVNDGVNCKSTKKILLTGIAIGFGLGAILMKTANR